MAREPKYCSCLDFNLNNSSTVRLQVNHTLSSHHSRRIPMKLEWEAFVSTDKQELEPILDLRTSTASGLHCEGPQIINERYIYIYIFIVLF